MNTKKNTRERPALIPPKLLRYILFDDGHGVYSLLVFGGSVHLVVFAEVSDVFGVGEVLFFGVCEGRPLSAEKGNAGM